MVYYASSLMAVVFCADIVAFCESGSVCYYYLSFGLVLHMCSFCLRGWGSVKFELSFSEAREESRECFCCLGTLLWFCFLWLAACEIFWYLLFAICI